MPGVISLPSYPIGLVGGASDRTIVGTGRGRPGGVESIWEYNGALLNIRDWYDTFVITSIDGLSDPDVRDARENNPGRDGETYFNAYYGGRTIVLTGYIRAYSLAKLRDMQQGLKQIFSDLSGERPLYIRTGDPSKDVFIYCKKSQPLAMGEAQTNFEFRRDFQITLRASNPRFLSYLEQRLSFIGGPQTLAAPITGVATSHNYSQALRPEVGSGVSGWETFYTDVGPTGVTVTNSAYTPLTYSWFTTNNRAILFGGTTPSSPTTDSRIGISIKALDGALTAGVPYNWHVNFWPLNHPVSSDTPGDGATRNYTIEVLWFWQNFLFDFGYITQTVGELTIANNAPAFIAINGVVPPVNVQQAWLRIYTDVTPSTPYSFAATDASIMRSSEPKQYYFDGDSRYATWQSGIRTSISNDYQYTTGLEDKYLDESTTLGSFRVDSDAWIKPTGPLSAPVRQVYRSDQSRQFADLQTTVKYRTGATVATGASLSGDHGVILKRTGPLDLLYFRVVPNGSSSALKITKLNSATGDGDLATSSSFTLAANTSYWLRAKVQGNVATIEQWSIDPATAPGGSVPTATTNVTLAGADATKYGAGVKGHFGFRSTIMATTKDWWWTNQTIDIITPEVIVGFNAANEGNAPAQPKFLIYGPLSSSFTGGQALRIGLVRNNEDGTTTTQNMYLNAKTGSTLAIPSGNYIEIDADKRTLKEFTSAGVFVRNSYDQLDISSDWIELPPGDNPVELQPVLSVTPTVEIRYRHTFF